MVLFYNMLDLSAINAFTIFTKLNPEWNANKTNTRLRRRLFLTELGEALVEKTIATRKRMPREPVAQQLTRTGRAKK